MHVDLPDPDGDTGREAKTLVEIQSLAQSGTVKHARIQKVGLTPLAGEQRWI